MGLNRQVINYLLRQWHHVAPHLEPQRRLLTLGVQDIQLTYEELEAQMRHFNVDFRSVPPAERETFTSVDLRNRFGDQELPHQRTFFRMLGADVIHGLDHFVDEEPDVVIDLNEPLPEKYRESYEVVLNGGTLEHVFDVRQSFTDVHDLLVPGGVVIHLTPVEGFIDHGFYQFSPSLFFDAAHANGYEVLAAHLLRVPGFGANWRRAFAVQYEYCDRLAKISPFSTSLFAMIARKPEEHRPFAGFQQGYYVSKAEQEAAAPVAASPKKVKMLREIVRALDDRIPGPLINTWYGLTRRPLPQREVFRL